MPAYGGRQSPSVQLPITVHVAQYCLSDVVLASKNTIRPEFVPIKAYNE
jgi:hypothetical protein